MDPFAPVPLFAFPVYTTLVGGFEDHRDALVAEILELRGRAPGLRRSNRGDAWHSGEELLRSRSAATTWVLQQVTAYARRCLAPLYAGWSKADLRLGSWWANVLGSGGWHGPHHHLPQHWSGVFYVAAPGAEQRAPDALDGCFEIVNPNAWQSAWGVGNQVYVPREGLTLLFPSSLVHLVHPHLGPGERISIAYNFDVVPRPR